MSAPSKQVVLEALKKNEQATNEIRSAAEDLAVVQTVLEQELSEPLSDDAAQAVAQTGQIEKRLSRSTKKLDEVNDSLRGEVSSAR
jgi:hypothetical protein